MSEDRFQEQFNRLNLKQKQAVEAIDGPVMVIAGPGTGKTQILTLRIANILLKTDTPADSILALTFTESAAANMRRRLVSIIGSRAYYVAIGTFHGFCNRLIQDYPENFESIIGSRNATAVDRIALIRELIETTDLKNLKPFGEKFFYALDILGAIRHLKNEGFDEDSFEVIVEKEKSELEKDPNRYHIKGAHAGKVKVEYQKKEKEVEKNRELALLYRKYQKELRSRKLYDFEDMILEVIKSFEKDKNFLLEIQEKFQYILVDEHQDTNGAQNRVLELLSGFYPNPNLFVVGDEKQAIFRFQGASLDNFLYFEKKYPSAKVVNLEENYRSTQNILDSAQDLIEKNKAALFSPLKAKKETQGEKIKIFSVVEPESEYLLLAKKIEELVAKSASKKEVAVIYRENNDALPIAEFLEKSGLPYVIESDLNVLDDPEIRKLNLIFKTINEFGNDEYLVEFLHLNFLELNLLDIYKLLDLREHKKYSLYNLISKAKNLNELNLEQAEKFTEIFNRLHKWKAKSENEDFVRFFERVVNESGFLNHLVKSKGYMEKLEKLSALFAEAKQIAENHRSYKLRDYLRYLEILESHQVLIKSRPSVSSDAVRLMTAHRAKGLEFDYVFITGAVDGHWGNKRKNQKFKLPIKTSVDISNIEKNEDERRLFYMALTRARKAVFITYAERRKDGRDQIPSQFLEEIKSELKEEIRGVEFDELISKNKEIIFAPRIINSPTLSDSALLKEIFLRRGLSVTALNNYLDCPWKYFYLNLLRIPRSKNKHQMFGTAVHYALKSFFDAKKEGHDVGNKFIIDQFKAALEKEPLNANDLKEVLAKGEKILIAYHNFYKNDWNYNTVNEFAINGVNLTEEIKLTGKLDKLELQSDPSKVIVVDYKTKKPETRNQLSGLTKNSTGDYKRQLAFYKLLLDLKPEKTWEMQAGVIDFIEPNGRGQFKKESFEIGQAEADELRELIKKVGGEILSLDFWGKKCPDKKCVYCGLRELMR